MGARARAFSQAALRHCSPLPYPPCGCHTFPCASQTTRRCINDVKEAVALVLGAYQLQVDMKDAKDHDRALLSFTKADGTFPTPDEVRHSNLPSLC